MLFNGIGIRWDNQYSVPVLGVAGAEMYPVAEVHSSCHKRMSM